MSSDSSISIVIPAYNEEARIENVLLNFCNSFPASEIIVVCNGCTDGTRTIVDRLCPEHPQIQALHFKEKLGKGGAIIEGFKAARGERIGFADADESVEPDEVVKMFDALADADVVIASRRLDASRITVQQPIMRRFASRIFNAIVRMMFGLDFKDTQCGIKVFRKEAIKSVLPSLAARGFEFDVELLWKLDGQGYRIVESPIVWKHSEGSTFRLSNAPQMFFSLLRIKCRRRPAI